MKILTAEEKRIVQNSEGWKLGTQTINEVIEKANAEGRKLTNTERESLQMLRARIAMLDQVVFDIYSK